MIYGIQKRSHRRRLKRLFENDRIEEAVALMPPLSSPEVGVIAFHKSRLASDYVSHQKRSESAEWLRQNGYKDVLGRSPCADRPGEFES